MARESCIRCGSDRTSSFEVARGDRIFQEMWRVFCRKGRQRRDLLSDYYNVLSIFHIQGPLNLRAPALCGPKIKKIYPKIRNINTVGAYLLGDSYQICNVCTQLHGQSCITIWTDSPRDKFRACVLPRIFGGPGGETMRHMRRRFRKCKNGTDHHNHHVKFGEARVTKKFDVFVFVFCSSRF